MSEQPTLEQELFEVIVYLVSSSVTSMTETPELATFRMIDAAERLMAISTSRLPDDFLTAARADWEAHKMLVVSDQPEYLRWLDGYARSFVRKTLELAAAPGA
ncbi:hypothetical protein GIS00_13800 [Nakamurella sp. YIM 132087]|uniref:Uncharacterized protein n=1 Tax=Nakamurella alba TaxID=2665158 RepID=A0A7K1FP62_9ACTN|nr:DUF6092 family protein [Nakamurella alba]MTD15013.1 hypothetical protein [Nakamurella alba]